jgi:serine/threonine protein kinase
MGPLSTALPFSCGRYECLEAITEGPLGETFRAKLCGIAGFEKQFAVTLLRPGLFLDETIASAVFSAAGEYAALRHERIGRVHEILVDGGRCYWALDLVRGLDLASVVRKLSVRGEKLSQDAILLIGLDIAEALTYAHGRVDLKPQGVLHLGLSPQSVILTHDGEVRLLDFGLLFALRGRVADDALMPTFAYSAPELLRNELGSPQSDVFSLGAILYELWAGHCPFPGESARAARTALEVGQFEPLEEGPEVIALIGRCLNLSVVERFNSAEEFALGVRAILGVEGATRARGELSNLMRSLISRPSVRTGAFSLPKGPVVSRSAALFGMQASHFMASPAEGSGAEGFKKEAASRSDVESAPTSVEPISAALPESEPLAPDADTAPSIAELVASVVPESPQVVLDVDTTPTIAELAAAMTGVPTGPLESRVRSESVLQAALSVGGAHPDRPQLPPEAAAAAYVKAELAEARSRSTGKRLPIPAAAMALVMGTSAVVLFRARLVSPSQTLPVKVAPARLGPAVAPRSHGSISAAALPAATRPAEDSVKASTERMGSAALSVISTPSHATVYVDGNLKGTTPIPLTADLGAHKIVLRSHGFTLWRREVVLKESGTSIDATLPLAKLPPGMEGPAGLKVRCRTQNELRIFVDGFDTGVDCPNDERISIRPGNHKIGLFSPRTEEMHEMEQEIGGGVHSTRVYVKY